jgi:hypothetical protein
MDQQQGINMAHAIHVRTSMRIIDKAKIANSVSKREADKFVVIKTRGRGNIKKRQLWVGIANSSPMMTL